MKEYLRIMNAQTTLINELTARLESAREHFAKQENENAKLRRDNGLLKMELKEVINTFQQKDLELCEYTTKVYDLASQFVNVDEVLA